MGVWYITRESVKAALDIKETARSNGRIDECIEQASRTVEGILHRRFYPELDTRYFDWPNRQYARPWRLWLDANEVISATELVAGGVTIPPSDYFLRRADGLEEPPYDHIEIDLSSNAAFSSGETSQRAIALTATFGYDARSAGAGALAEALDDSEVGVDVTDGSVGVGAILLVGSERMIVTGKSMLDTGQDTAASLAAQKNVETVAVASGAALNVGEIILIDAEKMLIVEIAGNNLIVKRAWDGSTLAAHESGADVYAPRTLTVERGALGTTAAAHNTAAAITRHIVPGPVAEFTMELTLTALGLGQAGYSSSSGSGESQRPTRRSGESQVRKDAKATYGRSRMGAV